ncbi:hypothetical protein F511_19268 [Dorcoceras hygrometricum]|uniref:Uncharacterized protein n=1 Tax=Dorcoceras hygrometricum TaxID=472368 RepID=A0A2Z7CZ80_9LAMI|nr:hypothetical protein F511_19268 [Dorcoceras hygrometricum]
MKISRAEPPRRDDRSEVRWRRATVSGHVRRLSRTSQSIVVFRRNDSAGHHIKINVGAFRHDDSAGRSQRDARASGDTALSSPCWDFLALMHRVVNYHSSWVGQRQVELFDAYGIRVWCKDERTQHSQTRRRKVKPDAARSNQPQEGQTSCWTVNSSLTNENSDFGS